ncbi:MAG: vitamin K epoxide reductase family protein [Acidobacteria bacterium]|nr:vitamin K epoxide reductase family protein [Acidobacteriota bacterium]
MKTRKQETQAERAGEPTVSRADAGRAVFFDALAALVALVGVFDATYLTVEHLSGRSVRCVVTSGCDEVLQSHYATLAGGIPLAALGALAYFTVFSLATLAACGYKSVRTLLVPLVALMFASTLWLFYLQAFVLHAFCTYCLLSAALTTEV